VDPGAVTPEADDGQKKSGVIHELVQHRRLATLPLCAETETRRVASALRIEGRPAKVRVVRNAAGLPVLEEDGT
jgi:hypothetical protein